MNPLNSLLVSAVVLSGPPLGTLPAGSFVTVQAAGDHGELDDLATVAAVTAQGTQSAPKLTPPEAPGAVPRPFRVCWRRVAGEGEPDTVHVLDTVQGTTQADAMKAVAAKWPAEFAAGDVLAVEETDLAAFVDDFTQAAAAKADVERMTAEVRRRDGFAQAKADNDAQRKAELDRQTAAAAAFEKRVSDQREAMKRGG